YGVDVALSNRTDPGTILVGVLYDEDRNIVMESEEHIVSASELNDLGEGQFISLPLLSPVDLVQNKDYFVALRHYGGTLDIWTATSGTSIPQTSLLLDYSDNTWYYVTVTPMVRMAFDPTLDIAERTDDGDLLRARPSVFQEFMWIDYSLTQPDEVSFLLRDMTGRVVLQEDLGQRPAGL
ncbi:MAG: hypothetical protein KDB77_15565, partial [Flavobacteriales bacterium]|nr:hypothetical protein [Flavobacteriales bacterium]